MVHRGTVTPVTDVGQLSNVIHCIGESEREQLGMGCRVVMCDGIAAQGYKRTGGTVEVSPVILGGLAYTVTAESAWTHEATAKRQAVRFRFLSPQQYVQHPSFLSLCVGVGKHKTPVGAGALRTTVSIHFRFSLAERYLGCNTTNL